MTSKTEGSEALCKYVAGYNECAAQVTQYLTSLQTNCDSLPLPDDARSYLLDHLANSLQLPQSNTPTNTPVSSSLQNFSPRATVNQSSSSSFPPSAVYVISSQSQRAPAVTSSTSPTHSQLHVRGGQFVLLLATPTSPAEQRNGGCLLTDNGELVKLDNCDLVALEPADCRFTGEKGLQECHHRPSEKLHVNSQSESSPAECDQVQNTDNLHTMWRPWWPIVD